MIIYFLNKSKIILYYFSNISQLAHMSKIWLGSFDYHFHDITYSVYCIYYIYESLYFTKTDLYNLNHNILILESS